MKTISKLGVSVIALAAMMSFTNGTALAADYADPGCTLNGAVSIGGMLGNQSYDGEIIAPDADDTDWSTLFGEGAGLVTCDAWNFQADFAYYDHSTEIEIDGKDSNSNLDIGGANGHFGGAVFWRDPTWALGLSASLVNQDTFFKDIDYGRVGVFGEFYVSDQFTLGGSAHYFALTEEIMDTKDHDGFELAALAKFYATPDFSLSLRGDMMVSEMSSDDSDEDIDFDGVAITGQAEYLVWDQGLSVFGGGRYANRELGDSDDSLEIEDMQVFVGLKFAFGGGNGSLVDRDRSGAYDNTSVMHEKLPSLFDSVGAAVVSSID